MAAYDDLNGTKIAVISVVSIVGTAVTILAVQVLYFAMAGFVDSQKVESASYSRQNLILAEQAEEISSFGVDADTGNITVPVTEVMKKMAAEASKNAHSTTNDQA
ncbi:hypothetical protein SAMN06265222_11321 [Neorhodopirellula lusitana]|uniref:Uncharacterized protein n=1 Tax=Neorhodopirellula lusitana TaxID=445327 RepID=A0ABY1QK75_9BACT|nr:hypothetical protein [Neorhodopirellula lusitana]SMP70287.1 hypothetical protein SAMN06265222_11321 [Neorhodopirellula lusitana]